MDTPEPELHFKLMSLAFGLRDIFLPRRNIIEKAGIKPGSHILDYGCGSGSYITAAAELVGDSGKIYALDIHPLAIERARRIAEPSSECRDDPVRLCDRTPERQPRCGSALRCVSQVERS